VNAVARVSALITMCTLCAKEALVSVPMHHTVATLLVFFPMRATIQLRGLRSSSEFASRLEMKDRVLYLLLATCHCVFLS
jgi:hypothetical protein